MSELPALGPCPPHLAELKRQIAEFYGPDFEQRATRAWKEILEELKVATAEIAKQGTDVSFLTVCVACWLCLISLHAQIVPQVDFADLETDLKEFFNANEPDEDESPAAAS